MAYPNYFGRPNESSDYTNLVMDLIDNPSNEFSGYGTFSPTDKVQYYNMIQIQEALRNAKTMNEWKNNIINNYENNTEQYVSELFDYWTIN